MSCDDVIRRLSEGEPLSQEASLHAAQCRACSALAAAWPQNLPSPDPSHVARIGSELAGRLSAVKPLPSNTVLWCIGMTLFAGLSATVAGVAGMRAIRALATREIALYYGCVMILAALFARAVVERMIPGARRFLQSTLALAVGALLAMAFLVFFLFEDRSLQDFVSDGIPCFRLGTISAVLGGLLGWRLLQRGCLLEEREAFTVYGFLAGLTGIAALALHCPIRNSIHFLAWHLSAMLLAGLAGLVFAGFRESRLRNVPAVHESS